VKNSPVETTTHKGRRGVTLVGKGHNDLLPEEDISGPSFVEKELILNAAGMFEGMLLESDRTESSLVQ
jgi:hypothetical protein